MLRMVCFRSCIMFSSLNNYRKEPSRDATVCLEITVATRRKTVYNAQLLSEFSTYISQRFWTLTKAMTTGSPQMDWQRQVTQAFGTKVKQNKSKSIKLRAFTFRISVELRSSCRTRSRDSRHRGENHLKKFFVFGFLPVYELFYFYGFWNWIRWYMQWLFIWHFSGLVTLCAFRLVIVFLCCWCDDLPAFEKVAQTTFLELADGLKKSSQASRQGRMICLVVYSIVPSQY